jgi:hypothetical protein
MGDVVATVACTDAVVGESPGVNIVVDSIEAVVASASAAVTFASASAVVEGIASKRTSDAVAASASVVVTEPCTLVAVGEAVAAGLGIVIDAVVADMPGIVVVVGSLAAVETAQMRGSAGRATGQRPEEGSVPPPDDTEATGGASPPP